MTKSIISTNQLTKIYLNPENNRPAVHNLTIDIKAGEIVALLGRNGAGKSTAIKMLLGREAPSWGSRQGHDRDRL